MSAILNYELSPKPGTIFGCLLPAPWIGAVAGLILAFAPAIGFPDRFSPLSLALTHWIALGMLAPIMIGALMQLMPVVAGQSVPFSSYISPFVALGSALIAFGLSLGFLLQDGRGFILAIVAAIILYGAVAIALSVAAWRVQVVDATTRTLKIIPIAFVMVIGLGITLAGALQAWWSINILHWLNNHVAWGLIAWVASLVVGVASTVVPMFWQTPRPNTVWHRFVPMLLWLPLLLLIFPQFYAIAIILGCLILAGISALALRHLFKAKRNFDPAWILWVICAFSWLMVALLVLISTTDFVHLPIFIVDSIPWWIGVFAFIGGAVFPVNAMLGKIIPFLIFLHLRRQIPLGIRVPTMQAVLPPKRLQWQARLLILSLVLLLLVPLATLSSPIFRIVAGLSFALSQAMMGSLLMMSLFRYRRELREKLFPLKASSNTH